MGCARGFPATWNDKITVLCNECTLGIYEGEVLPNCEFNLHEYGKEGNVISVRYQGA